MRNRIWRLRGHPVGNDFAAAVTLAEEECPAPRDGEVLARNLWLSMDAGTRMWMSRRTDGYMPATPVGSPVAGTVLAEVIDSRSPGFVTGDWVHGFGQWADLSLMRPDAAQLRVVDRSVADPRHHHGVLGPNGWTAYVGIVEVARAQPGETVLVSAAAGATGMLASQVARALGCRVIGIAGSAAKCAYLTEHLGLDAAIDRRTEPVGERLAALAPRGVNVYFDSVSGALLDAVLPAMALHGRIAFCGTLASYDRDEGAPGPARFDQILMRRLTIAGFFSPDFYHRGPALNERLRFWLDTGRIALPFDVTNGLENTLAAYGRLFAGTNLGKVLVRLN